jgi:hypothetical protein
MIYQKDYGYELINIMHITITITIIIIIIIIIITST